MMIMQQLALWSLLSAETTLHVCSYFILISHIVSLPISLLPPDSSDIYLYTPSAIAFPFQPSHNRS
jgi:hypothetical protein